ARNLVDRYGERLGALTSREKEPDERRQLVQAVRQFVDKRVVPSASQLDATHAHPASLVTALAELGILGAIVDPRWGGLGLDARTVAMILEEVARGSATLAAIVVAHLTAASAVARFGTAEQRERLLAPMTRGEVRGSASPRRASGWPRPRSRPRCAIRSSARPSASRSPSTRRSSSPSPTWRRRSPRRVCSSTTRRETTSTTPASAWPRSMPRRRRTR